MAIQILPKIGLAERLGTALGTGLGAGIQGLAQHKLAEIEQQKNMQKSGNALQALGLPKEFVNLPENLQGIALKNLLQQPGQQAYANILSSLLGGKNLHDNEFQNLHGLTQQQASELTKIALQKQKAIAQEKQFATKEQRIKQHHIDKETLPFFNETTKAAKGATDTNPVLNRMQELLNKGNLPNSTFYNLANIGARPLGLNLSSLINADSEEFEKLTNEFLKNAKEIFGSRLTNYDVSTFLKGIPTLSQSKEGKQRIINNLKTINQAALLRNKAMEKIIANNNGERPRNLSSLVENEVGPQLDELAEKFAQGTPIGKQVRDIEDRTANNIALNKEQIINQQQNKQTTPLEQIPLTGTQLSEAPAPSNLQEASRHLARSTARGLETIANIPADLTSLGLSAADLVTLGKIPQIQEANTFIKKNIDARNITKALTGESLEPKTEKEKKSDEIVSDLASFLLPVKGKIPFKSAAIKTALGNAASFLAEKIGVGPFGQGLAKIGSVLLYSTSGGRKALEEIKNNSGKIIDKLPNSIKTVVPQLEKDIDLISREVGRGFKTDAKTFISDRIGGLKSLIENGKASVKELWDEKVNLNELFSDPNTPQAAKKYIGRIVGSINKTLDKYGKKNKVFGNAIEKVNDIHRGLNQASEIAQAIQKNVKTEKLTSPLIKSILYGFKSPGVIGTVGAGVGTVTGIRKLTKFTQLLKNSNEAKKYYKNLVQAAARENASLVRRYAKKLDEIAIEEGY